jgi:hypothetical protein
MLYQLTSLVLGPPAVREIRVAWSIDTVESQEALGVRQVSEELRPQLGELLRPAPQSASAEPSDPAAGPIPPAVGPIPAPAVRVPPAAPIKPPADDDDETHAREHD